jgi:hypothetical protein
MRRLRSILASLVLTLAVLGGVTSGSGHASGPSGGGLVTHHVIADSFSGTAISPSVWAWYGTNQPDSVAFTQAGGLLRVDVSETATDDFNFSLGTRCRARGDFDALLSFRLVEWPARNGVWVSLMAADTDGFNVYRVSWHFGDGEAYGAYLPPAGTAVDASGDKGVLRLARRGSTWAGYYLSGARWILIASGVGPTSDISFSPGVFNIPDATPFGGQATTVAFQGFSAFAARVVCP